MPPKKPISSQRTLKVGENIKRTLASYFLKGSFWDDALKGVHLTISEVRMTPDLKTARIYVLPLNSAQSNAIAMKPILDALHGHQHEMRLEIGKTLTMKYMPRLHFVYDTTLEEAGKIESLLKADAVKKDLD